MAVDDAAFREFFASEYSRLCWLGFLLTGSRAEGEELAQEALVRIWWRWQPGRRPADPRARPAEAPPAGTERAMVLWEAVQALPPRQRAVLLRPRPGGQRHGGATMNLDGELRELFGQPDKTSWPGEATAYDRFLRRHRQPPRPGPRCCSARVARG